MTYSHRMAAVIAGIVFSLLLTACLAMQPETTHLRTHVLRMSDGAPVSTLNPLYLRGDLGGLTDLTMAEFTHFDDKGRPQPELITAVPTQANRGISPDGRTIVFHLRHGVRWSDGAPFDARDVLYSVAVIEDRANNIAFRSDWDPVTRVTSPDEYTVVFHLKAPYGSFAEAFFSNWGSSVVLPRHVLGARTAIGESSYDALPVGIGPFRYTAFRRGDTVEAEANPYYFRGRPKLQKIEYKIIADETTLFVQLQTGELDLWASANPAFYDRLSRLSGKRIATSLSSYITGIYFNVTRPPVRERPVRRALRLATDRELLFEKVYHGLGVLTESLVPRVSRDYDEHIQRTPDDPAQAERLLDAAGWKLRKDGIRVKDGKPLVVQVVISGGVPSAATVAEVLREEWARVGARLELHTYSFAQMQAEILPAGRFDAVILSRSGGVDAALYRGYGCRMAAPRGANLTRYCNRDVDTAMLAYASSYDPRTRATLARRFQEQLDLDVPAIAIFERADIAAFDKRVTGYRPKPFGQDAFLDVDAAP